MAYQTLQYTDELSPQNIQLNGEHTSKVWEKPSLFIGGVYHV